MSKGIEVFKKKPITNPTLHEGCLLLVYKYPKNQTKGKSLGHSTDALEDTRSSNYSNSKEVQSLSLEDEDNIPLKGKKAKGGERISPSTSIVPRTKIPWGLTPDLPKPKEQEDEEYNDEDEEMELEEKKGWESEKKKEEITILLGRPQEKEGQGGFTARKDKRSHY